MTVRAANIDLVAESPAQFRQDVAITDVDGKVQRYDAQFSDGMRTMFNARYALIMWVRKYRDTGPFLNSWPDWAADITSYCVFDSINDFDRSTYDENGPTNTEYVGKQPNGPDADGGGIQGIDGGFIPTVSSP